MKQMNLLQDEAMTFDLGNDIYGEIKNVVYDHQTGGVNYEANLFTYSKDRQLLSDSEQQEYLDILSKKFKEYMTSSLEQFIRSAK